jgi:3-deoxy-D-manno-octulosonic acid kinase
VKLPEGYAAVRTPRAWGFVVEDGVDWLGQTLAAGGTLYQWAAEREDRRELVGRGRVYSVTAPFPGSDARDRWVVRHYLRGGAVARFLTDRYLSVGRPRPMVEACAAREARARGVPTPAAVAGAVYFEGPFYRADLVTEEVPDAADLARVLFGPEPVPVDQEAALAASGRLVRSLERAGLLHPDLNAKNIVLHGAPEEPRAHLVDLDRCCARTLGIPAPAFPMRRRLERSLRKFEIRTGRRLSAQAWAALRAGFEDRG